MTGLMTEEDEAIRETARRFAVNCVAPRAAEIDETDECFFDLIWHAGALGLIAVEASEEVGGASFVAAVLATMEVARAAESGSWVPGGNA